jgi:hypothetical protein
MSDITRTAKRPSQDFMQATPRNLILGYLADLAALSYAPQRTQQMQGIAQFFGAPSVSQTLDRLSYGEPLTTGAGGLGGTTRVRPEAIEAAMTVAPMVGPAARMTKGLPVGMGIKDVSGLAKSETFGKKLPGLKTEEAYMGTGVPINVRSNPEVSNMKFYVDDSGQANLEINPVFANDMSYVKNRHFRAVDDFLWPHGEDVYVRGANTKDDFDYLKSKTHRGSKNWATNEQEGGLSVGRGVEATMFPYSYLVKGKRIGSGSDSEPLLDLASAEPVGKLMTQKQMQAFLKKANEKKLASLGIEDYQMRALRSVPLLKKIETESTVPTAKTAATAAAMGVAAPDLMAQEQPNPAEAQQRAMIMRDIGTDPYTIHQQTGVWLGGNE